jgi:DNA-binding MarR family transcriptional regulator
MPLMSSSAAYANMVVMTAKANPPLGYLLHRVVTRFRTEVTAAALDPVGLAFPQYLCMRLLAQSSWMTNADLARAMNVSPQAMNSVVSTLCERGLIQRPTYPSSGRSLPMKLTDAGTELLMRTDRGVREAERRLLADVTAQQRRVLKQILAAMI